MARFIGRRLIASLPILFGITALVFLILHLLPGDPAQIMLFGTNASPDQVRALRGALGLDRPLLVQYGEFLWRLLHADLGISFITQRRVAEEIAIQFPATATLAFVTMVFATGIGLLAGTLAAVYRHSWVDGLGTGFSVLGVAIPNFWLSVLLILVFAVRLGWLPALGEGGVRGIILPAASLGWGFSAIITRLCRSSLIEVLTQPYIAAAYAKGMRASGVVVRHALKNALIPVVTLLGLQLGNLLSGAVVVETIFGRQGIGALAVRAILAKDFPMIQGVVLVVALVYVLVNLLVDVTYAALDPRVHYG
ncbi:MAG TPA: ABC transporter permease [Gemmatimonadales bacterium]|nr:ABC transporter permease [Gemmatimonadales bacterium]